MRHSLLLLCALATSMAAHATDYSTLSAGAWTSPSVWSTDGVSPCGCNPGSNFNDKVTVRHAVQMDMDITVGAAGTLNLQETGSLDHPDFQLTVYGTVNSYGTLRVKSLKTMAGGSFVSAGLVRVTQGPMENSGSMIVNGPFEVEQGIFENKAGAYFAIGPNVRVVVMEDDAFNKGTIEFMGGGACLHVQTKNLYNQNPGGSVVGFGGVMVQGELVTHGTWEPGVNWCALGGLKGSTPMPPENCSGVCSTPYPVVLADFRADLRADYVNLSWHTAAEDGLRYFAVERSTAAEACVMGQCTASPLGYVELAQVPALGRSSSYYYTDKEAQTGVLLYRLRMVESGGEYTYSPVVVVNKEEGLPGLLIYPNPTQGELNIRITGAAGSAITVDIYDITGKRIWQHKGSLSGPVQELTFPTCNLASGTYLVKYNHQGKEEVRKLVVQH